jgi:protein-S-isoprenylcysteine O-methyltransferase Ste14
MSHPAESPRDYGPNVRFPPPLLYVLGFAAGALLERRVPLAPLFAGLPIASLLASVMWMRIVGVVVMLVGAALMLTGVRSFRRAGTPIVPLRPARSIVDTGVYARTRNPMYLGFAIVYAGGAIAARLVWPLALLPLVLSMVYLLVIRHEETHLHAAFPDEYAEYTGKVRRWF